MRILVVEDDPVQAGVLGLQLLQAGHTVSVASSGLEAIALVRKETFEIVLLDLNMPGMSGLETLRYLVGEQLCGDTPILMLTASDDEADVLRAKGLGAAGYIEKPCTPAILVQKIERLVYARDTSWIDDYHALLAPGAGAAGLGTGVPRVVTGGSRS